MIYSSISVRILSKIFSCYTSILIMLSRDGTFSIMKMRQTDGENRKPEKKEETSEQPRLCRHTIQRIANSPIHSQSDGTENEPNRTPMVAMTPDDSTIVCWHPEPTFPYEYTKPLPTRKDKDLGMGDSVLKVEHHRDYMERYRTRGPSKKELAAMFYTSKHQWFPNKKKRFIKPYPPRDRPGL